MAFRETVNVPLVIVDPRHPGGGRTDGVLATGTITEANFVGPLAGHPFSDLLDAIESGNAYVNVHTAACKPGERPVVFLYDVVLDADKSTVHLLPETCLQKA